MAVKEFRLGYLNNIAKLLGKVVVDQTAAFARRKNAREVFHELFLVVIQRQLVQLLKCLSRSPEIAD